ncbi:unnamed protein product [Ciceribacter selenitireducens ATCC BAA-1503]|uniref:Uncharacterized protein n=1 Tax=Ciceribacter selenitireducens ATCC BAA-1503 TaxID=1336235 RepID=A0A376A9B1_9HYPH|nr:unnamed protein product [Ciceribacter selenitireducens ATCC BAA-1503]
MAHGSSFQVVWRVPKAHVNGAGRNRGSRKNLIRVASKGVYTDGRAIEQKRGKGKLCREVLPQGVGERHIGCSAGRRLGQAAGAPRNCRTSATVVPTKTRRFLFQSIVIERVRRHGHYRFGRSRCASHPAIRTWSMRPRCRIRRLRVRRSPPHGGAASTFTSLHRKRGAGPCSPTRPSFATPVSGWTTW